MNNSVRFDAVPFDAGHLWNRHINALVRRIFLVSFDSNRGTGQRHHNKARRKPREMSRYVSKYFIGNIPCVSSAELQRVAATGNDPRWTPISVRTPGIRVYSSRSFLRHSIGHCTLSALCFGSDK